MKRLIAFLLFFICLFGVAYADSSATPTDLDDLIEIDDENWGEIDIPFERKVYITVDEEPLHIGDLVTLTAVLVDFLPEDNVLFQWEYSADEEDWILIDDATEQIYTFILDEINVHNLYRVVVKLEGIK